MCFWATYPSRPTTKPLGLLNGKGIAGAASGSSSRDFEGDSRETTYGLGIDIGADEFTPDANVLPHALTLATPTAGGTNMFVPPAVDVASAWGSRSHRGAQPAVSFLRRSLRDRTAEKPHPQCLYPLPAKRAELSVSDWIDRQKHIKINKFGKVKSSEAGPPRQFDELLVSLPGPAACQFASWLRLSRTPKPYPATVGRREMGHSWRHWRWLYRDGTPRGRQVHTRAALTMR